MEMERSGVSLSESNEIWSCADKVCSIDDLLTKILAGLPLSSLRLFKSVSKRWLSLINDPTFSRSPKADNPFGLLLQLQSASSEFAYLPLDKTSLITTISFPLYPTNSQYIQVWQSCKGLLLCYGHPNKLYLYNPTINQCKLLPLPHAWEPYRFVEAMALALDHPPHYKILYAREDDDCTDVHIEIYSSQTGTWRAYDQTFDPEFFDAFDARVVYWHGAIHWLSRVAIYHFSLDIDNPHFIQVENHITLYGIRYGLDDKLLVSSCDCLLLVRMLQPLQMNVYQMNNTDCYSSGWSVKYHVNLEESAGNFPGPEFKVLAIVLGNGQEDSFLVLEVAGIMLMRYNIISKTFHQLCDLTRIRLRPAEQCSFFFTPSLVGV